MPLALSEQESLASLSEKTAKSVIFLDWDDTILCSSHLASLGHTLGSDSESMNVEFRQQLSTLESAAISVISAAKLHGDVYIVTNGDLGWVELSAKKFIPGVLPILSTVPIFSARFHFEKYDPNPISWKFNAFRWLLGRYGPAPPLHIMSFGDSMVEREAVRQVCKLYDGCRIKTIKLADSPSIEQLCRQLALLLTCLPDVVTHQFELDLALTISEPLASPSSLAAAAAYQ
jgi:hypothetical protein